MNQLIPFGSGKGGVGKSLLVSNLAIALGKMGRTVILLDLDLGAANLHTFFGIKNNKEGLGNLLHRQKTNLESLIIPTPYERIYFIPGDNLLPETANHPYYMKLKILKEIQKLTADYIFLDLGAGSNFNTLDYMSVIPQPMVVITPEPTSILNAYSLIKNTLFRIIIRNFSKKSEKRIKLKELLLKRMEGKDWNLSRVKESFLKEYPEESELFENLNDKIYPHIVINMGRGTEDFKFCIQLRKMCRRNLDLEIKYFGFLHYEDSMHLSVKRRHPFVVDHPQADFTRDIQRLSEALETRKGATNPPASNLPEEEDLQKIFY